MVKSFRKVMKAETSTEKTYRMYKTILDNIHDGIFFENTEKKVIYWNRGAERITGYSSYEVIGRSCGSCIIWAGSPESCPLKNTLSDGIVREFNIKIKKKSGEEAFLIAKVYPIKDEEGKVIGTAGVFTDNSSLLETVKELEKLILLDPLTGVGNRRFLEIQLRAFMDRFRRYRLPFGVMFLDIDDFKRVNDTYGHNVGDKVLRTVARTLLTSSRSFDVIGRWGGEEFLGIIENVDMEKLGKVSERHRKAIQEKDIAINGEKIRVTVSIGATVVREGDTLEELVARADRLMYESKRKGKNRVTLG